MKVLIVKNIISEGPGTIEDFLREKDVEYSILELFDCKAEIPVLNDFSHLVVMGAPMGVYEIEDYPFLHYETAMIRTFIKTGKSVLGICLGAQMIAHSLGARVYPGGTEEIGWDKVDITDEGMKDPVFSSLAIENDNCAEVFQWHGDTFDLPKGAIRISSSKAYENQAFRYKNNVYALQFHIEVQPEIIKEWFRKEDEGHDVGAMLAYAYRIFPEYHKRAFSFYNKFFS